MKSRIVILSIFLLTCCIITGSVSQIIRVPEDFSLLQEAIWAAPNNEGAIIEIQDSYICYENVEVKWKSDLTIRGRAGSEITPIIQGQPGYTWVILLNTSDHITIEGLVIRTYSEETMRHGINCYNSEYVYIRNNTIESVNPSMHSIGIQAGTGVNKFIRDNYIYGFNQGVTFNTKEGVSIGQSDHTGNLINTYNRNINWLHSGTASVYFPRFWNNELYAADTAFFAQYSTNLHVNTNGNNVWFTDYPLVADKATISHSNNFYYYCNDLIRKKNGGIIIDWGGNSYFRCNDN